MSSWEKAATPTRSRPVQANVETSALSSGVCGVGRAMDVPWTRQESDRSEEFSLRTGCASPKAGSSAFDERGLWVLRRPGRSSAGPRSPGRRVRAQPPLRVSTIFAVRKEKLERAPAGIWRPLKLSGQLMASHSSRWLPLYRIRSWVLVVMVVMVYP